MPLWGAPQCLQVCRRGQEQISNTTCSDCPPGKTSTDSDKTPSCKSCPLGSIARKSGSPYCETCEAGKVSNYLRTGCESCPQGKERPGYSKLYPEIPERSFFKYGAHCEAGMYPGENRTHCLDCPRMPFHPRVMRSAPRAEIIGLRRRVLEDATLAILEPNLIKANTLAIYAQKGKERPHTISICATCKDGFVAPNNGTAYCDPCPAGTYAANETTCVKCPAGAYCQQGSSEPTLCSEDGTYCPEGSSNPLIAKAGNYTNSDRSGTTICEPGFYCVNGKKTPCPANTFGNSYGLTSEKCDGICDNNLNRNSNIGATNCSCKASFVNQLKNTSDLDCVCPAGTHKSKTWACAYLAKMERIRLA